MTIAVVPDDDCNNIVSNTPMMMPENVLEVYLSMYSLSLSPATAFRPSPIKVMPNINKPNPPKIMFQLIDPKVIFPPDDMKHINFTKTLLSSNIKFTFCCNFTMNNLHV